MYPQGGFLQEATLWACMRGYGRVGGEVAWGSIGMSIGIMIEIEIVIVIDCSALRTEHSASMCATGLSQRLLTFSHDDLRLGDRANQEPVAALLRY